MYKIILISHGELSLGFLNAAELIAGKHSFIDTYSLYSNTDLVEFETSIYENIKNSNDNGECVVVLSDLMYGTPFNILARLSQRCTFKHLTGMNLAVLLELILSNGIKELDDLMVDLDVIGKDSLLNFDKEFMEENEE